MNFREYLIENEQAAKLVELGKRRRAELQNLQNARQRGDIDTAKYWNSAQMNTQKEIEKIEIAMTKPKRADSKKASDEVEVVHGWKTTPGDKSISITHAGETKVFNKKKDAIHHLLDKGLSAADVQRKGFSGLTVQGAKKDWKTSVVTAQKNAYRQEVKDKEEAEFENANQIKVDFVNGYPKVDLSPIVPDLNKLLSTVKPEAAKLFKSFSSYNNDIRFGNYGSQGWIRVGKDGISINYNSNGAHNGIKHSVNIPLKLDNNLKSKEILAKIKSALNPFFDEWEKNRSAEAKSFSDYLKRTGDYYG